MKRFVILLGLLLVLISSSVFAASVELYADSIPPIGTSNEALIEFNIRYTGQTNATYLVFAEPLQVVGASNSFMINSEIKQVFFSTPKTQKLILKIWPSNGKFVNDFYRVNLTAVNTKHPLDTINEDFYFIVFNETPLCTPNWQCSNWSGCVGSTQTRVCTDTNSCENITSKPNETQACQQGDQSGISLSFDKSGLVFNVEPGADLVSDTFTVTNTGNTTFTNVQVAKIMNTLDEDDDSFVFDVTSTSTGTLASGESFTVSVAVKDVENKFDVGTINGEVKIITAQNYNKTMPVTVEVNPLLCKYGEVGNDLVIDIKSPDGEYSPGEKISAVIEIENNDNDDLDVRVEAVIYNVDSNNKIETYKSSAKKINNDDSEKFEFEFTLDYDEIDPSDEIVMYIIAYDDDHENQNCVASEESLDLIDEDDLVNIASFEILPGAANCGETVEATIDVHNVGNDDQDNVYVSLSNTLMGLSVKGNSFDLEKLGDSDDEVFERLTFTIPSNAKVGSYEVRAYVHYAGKSTYEVFDFDVIGCGSKSSEPSATPTDSKTSTPNPQAGNTPGSSITGGAIVDKNIFDTISDELPLAVWVLIYVVLGLGIIALLVAIFRRK